MQQLAISGEALQRIRDRLRITRRYQQPVHPVLYYIRDASDRRSYRHPPQAMLSSSA